MLDPTKPIVLVPQMKARLDEPLFGIRMYDPVSRQSLAFRVDDVDAEPFLAYQKLFEEAPRTKLEHGKMLAMLKLMLNGSDGLGLEDHNDEARALIAEIEGPPINYEEDWLRSKYLCVESFEDPKYIPPIEGGYYGKPLKVLAVTPSPDYVGAPYLTIEYENGFSASGLVLFGADREQFEAAQKKYLAGLGAGPVEGAAG